MIEPPLWTSDQLETERLRAIDVFRKERLQEPLEAYLEFFEDYQRVFEDLLEQTIDLSRLREDAVDALTDRRLQEAIRYLTGPPISLDDWKVVADASLSSARLGADPGMVDRVIQVVIDGLDRRRKADLLGDHRVMPVECKVSNSYINSIKRLNNDAAAKAEDWIQGFGARNVIPTAVLSGVYKLRSLENAQRRGLTIFWAHDLTTMVAWIEATRA